MVKSISMPVWVMVLLVLSPAGCGTGLLEGPTDAGQDSDSDAYDEESFEGSAVLSISSGADYMQSESYSGLLDVGSVTPNGTAKSEHFRFTLEPEPSYRLRKDQ